MGQSNMSGPLYIGGVPTLGTGGLPPWTGRYIFVNETTGADGNPGTATSPVATLTQAHSLATANEDDVVVFQGTIHVSAKLTWSKNRVHLIGTGAPCENTRSRISQTGSTVFSPLVDVTAQGCVFANFGTFHGFDDASTQICWKDEGGRNSYFGVSFFGMGNTTAGAQAGGRSLLIAGSTGENQFEGCYIGLDTVTRSTTNASLEFTGGSPRNNFKNCVFQALTSSSGSLHITVGSGGIDRYARFQGCSFINCVESGGTAMSVAIIANASAGGLVLLDPTCVSVGATVWATTGPVYGAGPVPTATTSSLAIKYT